MKNEHTPGPWRWMGINDSASYVDAEGLRGPDFADVIRLSDDYPGYSECGEHLIMEMSIEDARLIVAAPEMHELIVRKLADDPEARALLERIDGRAPEVVE